MNAPEAGVIKEFLANEDDTVTVGQDLVRIELGGAPSGDKPAAEPKKEESAPEKKPEPEAPAASKAEESKPAAPAPAPPKKETPAPPKQESKPAPAAADKPATLGNREERRVSYYRCPFLIS